ncbi:MAG: branched-chain amino acid transport system permease protein [Pseudonocardiales bacterium]|nr:branched-chain amino acid transport system permease protein [Pseudonocardiales bacterium]
MNEVTKQHVKRLVLCLLGSVLLAIMIGPQEGTLTDFGISFHDAVLKPRIGFFLAIGVLIYLAITFWPRVRPYIRRPGVVPLASGVVLVFVSQAVMNWYDPLLVLRTSAKFSTLRDVVDKTSGLDSTTTWFFVQYGSWTLVAIAVLATAACLVTGIRPLGYLTTAAGLVGAVVAWMAHQDVVDFGEKGQLGFDHSLGAYVDVVAFLVLAGAGIVAARSRREIADTGGFATSVIEWRPGLPFAVVGVLFGVFAFTRITWVSPLSLNDNFGDTGSDFKGYPISSLASNYLDWLGWLLFVGTAVLALAATLLAHRLLAWAAAVVSLAGVVCTFFSIKSMTEVAAKAAPQLGVTWQNLGIGGYVACIVFTLFAAASVQAAVAAKSQPVPTTEPAATSKALPFTKFVNQARTARGRAMVIAVLGLALFYPPMLTTRWQAALVASIGVYVLLALGLNVVIGWAGLLDLGYIAFVEVGAYTTAYFVGALPKKPPDWLTLKPLETIPLSILACLLAGVVLGAPTLRLRGDYLAIVTLGFGEIIQLLALNDVGGLTGGTTRAPHIAHPRIDLPGIDITWGQDSLPYWYLLLVMLVVVIVLFWRLEASRLGRAWAAIREDEVAAQASGVNTFRVKLLAFAIGASTSGLAGTFYASQIGYFDPTLFTLQLSILIVAYVVFGGMGSLMGAMAGAAVLTWLPEFLKDQVPQPDRPLWIGALVLLMMIFRPEGLIPERRRKAELSGLSGISSAEVGAVPASEGL